MDYYVLYLYALYLIARLVILLSHYWWEIENIIWRKRLMQVADSEYGIKFGIDSGCKCEFLLTILTL